MTREAIFKRLVEMLIAHGAKKVAVFGSYARGDQTQKSDLDVIVEFKKRKSLLQLVKIEREVSEALGIKIDLLTEKSISPYLLETIRTEMKVLCE